MKLYKSIIVEKYAIYKDYYLINSKKMSKLSQLFKKAASLNFGNSFFAIKINDICMNYTKNTKIIIINMNA